MQEQQLHSSLILNVLAKRISERFLKKRSSINFINIYRLQFQQNARRDVPRWPVIQ